MTNTSNTFIFEYICRQSRFFGELSADGEKVLEDNIPAAIQQTQNTLDKFASTANKLDVLHSHHSVIFIYKLARLVYENSACVDVSEKLFLLNRMINSIDLYYKINMPEHFLIGHGLGTVFSRAQYGNYLVVYQNVTVGVQDGVYPIIGNCVVIYPNSVVIGQSVIGHNSVVGAGTKIINKVIPDDSIVFEKDGVLVIKKNTRKEIKKYFLADDSCR